MFSNTIKNNQNGIDDFLCRGWNVYVESGTNSVIFLMNGFSGPQYLVGMALYDSTINQATSFPVQLDKLQLLVI